MKYVAVAALLLGSIVGLAQTSSAMQTPLISTRSARNMVQEYLSHYSPNISIALDDGTRESAEIDDLIGAGILVVRSRWNTDCYGTKLALLLTEKGQRIAAARGWLANDGVLTIPLGRYTSIDNLFRIRPKRGKPYSITFRYRYENNRNERYLLSLGRAVEWVTSAGKSLADMQKTFEKTAYLRFSRGRGWWLYAGPPALRRLIVC